MVRRLRRRGLLLIGLGSVAARCASSMGTAGREAVVQSRWRPEAASLRPVHNPPERSYSYAPSVIVDGATEHIWSCQNTQPGVIRDHIFYTRRVRGVIRESRSVLSAGLAGALQISSCSSFLKR